MKFKNRNEAAQKLIPLLKKFENDDVVILAVPRGGVPLGYYISQKYGFPLQLVMTKKIGHPYNPEYAIGAVSTSDVIVDTQEEIPDAYIESEALRIRKILHDRCNYYIGDRKPVSLRGRTIIIVDDGIATGLTMVMTIKLIRKQHPQKVVVAVPVAPPEIAARLKELADEFICLLTPYDFRGVGQYYHDFSEINDDEVKALMDSAARHTLNDETG